MGQTYSLITIYIKSYLSKQYYMLLVLDMYVLLAEKFIKLNIEFEITGI